MGERGMDKTLKELKEILALQETILARYKNNVGEGGPAEANYHHQLAKIESIRAEIKALEEQMMQANG